MRRNIPAIFVISTLIMLVMCSACVSQSSPQSSPDKTPQQNVGLTQISEGSPFISFDDAYENLRDYKPDPANESTAKKTVYYIHGTNVDGSGNATSWLFGVRHSGGTELLAYDRSGWIQIPWNVSLFSDEIDVDRIVSPGSLFSQNNAVIIGNPSSANPERRDFDLIRGIYTLTITSASKDRILTFNATTGKLIS